MNKKLNIYLFGALPALVQVAGVSAEEESTSPQRLFQAAAVGDVAALQMLVPRMDPNLADNSGKTALMAAAEQGKFEAARFLVQNGADARQRDGEGRSAVGYLSSSNNGFAPINLLLRCSAYVRELKPAGRVKIPHLVLVNDFFVDYSHPDIAALYVLNKAEQSGEPGKDDDGNGFVDDIFGWNVEDNQALRRPFASFLDEADEQAFVKKLIEEIGEIESAQGEEEGWESNPLMRRYENPLVRDIGMSALGMVNADFNDYVFGQMVLDASHGTHVAGIIAKASQGQSKLHAMTLESRRTREEVRTEDWEWTSKLAAECETYTQFMIAVREELQSNNLRWGERAGDYVRSSGAGVMNMSWGKQRGYYEQLADRMQEVYEEYGANPETMLTFACPIGVDLCANLALELMVADSAGFVRMIANNPDVLFVISAGNSGENCDMEMPSPGYLSRFLPNVITVAWLMDDEQISEYSNYGRRSVQIGALGENVVSSVLGGGHASMSGTSMAAPQVAGVAGLIRAQYPTLTAAEVRRILEISARSQDKLKDVVTTGGVLDSAGALAIAAKWKPGLEPLRDVELARLETGVAEGDDGPRLSRHGRAGNWFFKNEGDYQDASWRISAQGGFPESWLYCVSQGTGFEDQVVISPDKDPWERIVSFQDEGYEITSLAGDSGAWTVTLSRGKAKARKQLMGAFDQTWLSNAMEENYAITSLAGWQSAWRVVMTEGTGFGKQRFTLPGEFGEKRKAWIQRLWDEGYRITSLAGDLGGEDGDDSWMVVMSQDSGLGEQRYQGVGPWPEEWLTTQMAEGFRVTGVAGFDQNWVVVVSKGTSLGEQKFVGPDDFSTWELQSELDRTEDE